MMYDHYVSIHGYGIGPLHLLIVAALIIVPFPSEPMKMWPISTRVNKPENDDSSILERVDEPVGIIAK